MFTRESTAGDVLRYAMIQRAVHILAALGVAVIFSASLVSCIREQTIITPRPAEMLSEPPVLRVCVALREEACAVRCSGPVALFDGSVELKRWDKLPRTDVRPAPGGISVGTERYKAASVRFVSLGGALLGLGGQHYRGSMRIDRARDGKTVDAVNLIGMEKYLASVVGSEAYSNWPMETLKAQAVAARTFALLQSRRREGRSFHLRATQADQVYKGLAGESRRVVAAVNATRGCIITYGPEHRPLMSFYCSCCGGQTTSASAGLGERDIPPLRGVKCRTCDPRQHLSGTGTPRSIYHWIVRVDKPWLAEELRKRDHKVAEVRGVQALDIDASGRPRSVQISTDQAEPVVLAVKDFRRIVGTGRVKSAKFELDDDGGEIKIEGFGWGHGVGMCQWGAKGMGDKGYNHMTILAHYYPGAEVVRIYE